MILSLTAETTSTHFQFNVNLRIQLNWRLLEIICYQDSTQGNYFFFCGHHLTCYQLLLIYRDGKFSVVQDVIILTPPCSCMFWMVTQWLCPRTSTCLGVTVFGIQIFNIFSQLPFIWVYADLQNLQDRESPPPTIPSAVMVSPYLLLTTRCHYS